MILKLVTLKDIKTGAYQAPTAVAHLGAAIRAFEDGIKSPNKDTDIARHPEDFELYELGTYNDENGKIDTHETPKFIMGGTNV